MEQQYRVVGKFMEGNRIIGYELEGLVDGSHMTVYKEQLAYLVTAGYVPGYKCRLYNDTVTFEAIDGGTPMSAIPVLNRTPSGKNSRASVNVDNSSADENISLIGKVEGGGFVVSTSGGNKIYSREQLIHSAENGKILNARVQNWNNGGRIQKIIRLSNGKGLKDLPVYRPDK